MMPTHFHRASVPERYRAQGEKMDEKITPLQQKVLDFISDSIEDRGLPPTIREIKDRCKIPGPSSVAYHLKMLEEKGFLKKMGSLSRGLRPTEHALGLPIVGRVGAGGGVIAQQDVEGHLNFRNFTLGTDYLLRVRGDSMEGLGIMEGDLVQVRRQPAADDGDIVVALVGEESVVKTLKRRGREYHLDSANDKYAPITVGFQVIGKVLGLVRRYSR